MYCKFEYENNCDYETSICDECHKKVFVGNSNTVTKKRALHITPWNVTVIKNV